MGAVLGAWDDWCRSPRVSVWRCKRSRANFVWEQIIERSHLAFAEEPAVRILDGDQTFRFLVDEHVLFRFKKGDDSGLSANVPTQLAIAFHDHQQSLFGLPQVHRVEVVYQLNRLETEIADVIVVARSGNAVAWTYSLLDAGEAQVPVPTLTTREELTPKPATQMVRPRFASEAQDESNKRD